MAEATCPTPAQRAQWLVEISRAIAAGRRQTDRLREVDMRVAFWIQELYLNSKSGDAWPGQKRLAAELGRSERTVWASLDRLELHGFLAITRRQGTSSIIALRLGGEPLDASLDPHKLAGQVGGRTRTNLRVRSGGTGTDSPSVGGLTRKFVHSGLANLGSQVSHKRANDSHEETPLSDSHDSRRQRSALIGLSDSILESQLQRALRIWNDMRESIGADPLHKLRESHRDGLLAFLASHGLNAWQAVVGEVQLDDGLNGRAFDPPNPVRLGKLLLRSQELLERATHDGRYTMPSPTDDSAMLL